MPQCCVLEEPPAELLMPRVYDSSLANSLPTIFATIAISFALGALTHGDHAYFQSSTRVKYDYIIIQIPTA